MAGKEAEAFQTPKKTPYKINDIASQKFARKAVKNSTTISEKKVSFIKY